MWGIRRPAWGLSRWIKNPPTWLRWIEFIAVVVGIGAVVFEFWVKLPQDQDLRDIQLHATVATLSAEENKDTISPAVQRLLVLMHREGVDMRGISIPDITLRMADFDHVDWSESYMNGTKFACSELVGDDVPIQQVLSAFTDSPSTLLGKGRRCAHLRYAHFDGATLRNVRLKRADLSHATFSGTQLAGFEAVDVDFSYARFVRAHTHLGPAVSVADRAIFDCHKTNRHTENCVKLNRVVFFMSDLSRVVFRGAEIKNACFQSAVLDQATFTDVRITNSDFSDASLSGARFTRVTFDNVVFPTKQVEIDKQFDETSRKSLHRALIERGDGPKVCAPT